MTIESPCIKVCKIKDDVCIGCDRTIDQIMEWTKYTDGERAEIMDAIKEQKNISKLDEFIFRSD